jgi:hypothetical protein
LFKHLLKWPEMGRIKWALIQPIELVVKSTRESLCPNIYTACQFCTKTLKVRSDLWYTSINKLLCSTSTTRSSFFFVWKNHIQVSNSWKLPLETSTGNLPKTERSLSTPQACHQRRRRIPSRHSDRQRNEKKRLRGQSRSDRWCWSAASALRDHHLFTSSLRLCLVSLKTVKNVL